MRILATSGGFLPAELGVYQWRPGPLIAHAIHLAGDPARRKRRRPTDSTATLPITSVVTSGCRPRRVA